MELQCQGLCTILIKLLLCDIASLDHLAQHDITTVATALRMTDRVIVRRVLTEAYKCSCLGDSEVLRLLTEIDI